MKQSAQYNSSRYIQDNFSNVHIIKSEKMVRPTGYSLPGYEAAATTISRNGFEATGFGEGIGQVANDKALSEAIERSVLMEFACQQKIVETSNGWSCHRSATLALENAIFELIERDVALTAWQSGGPFMQLPEELWPTVLTAWKTRLNPRPEFFDLRILLSETENGACISALLFNDRGNFVAGHAAGTHLESVIISATAECLRSAHAAIRLEYFADVLSLHAGTTNEITKPGVHSLAYAYTFCIPNTVKIIPTSSSQILEKWQRQNRIFHDLEMRDFEVTLFHVESHVVARVKNKRYRQIFWGQDSNIFCFQNNSPHFVG